MGQSTFPNYLRRVCVQLQSKGQGADLDISFCSTYSFNGLGGYGCQWQENSCAIVLCWACQQGFVFFPAGSPCTFRLLLQLELQLVLKDFVFLFGLYLQSHTLYSLSLRVFSVELSVYEGSTLQC